MRKSLALYQERLNWAYKKLEELYPEFNWKRRKAFGTTPKELPAPLYLISSDGEKTMPIPREKRQSFIFKAKSIH